VSIWSSAADGLLRRDILLRVTLAVPLLYVLLRALPPHWSWVFPSDQALDFYVVNGLLFGIPIAVWVLALVLLLVGSVSRILWTTVCVGGFAIAIYGLLSLFDGYLRLNPDLAFGIYAVLLGLWQSLERRGRQHSITSEPQT